MDTTFFRQLGKSVGVPSGFGNGGLPSHFDITKSKRDQEHLNFLWLSGQCQEKGKDIIDSLYKQSSRSDAEG